jgi:hypothetical protein
VVEASVDVYMARGLLDDYVESISVAIKQKSGFKTTPRAGYLGNRFRAKRVRLLRSSRMC